MNRIDEVRIRLSELRTALNTRMSQEERSEDDITAIETDRKEYHALETEYRSLITLGQEPDVGSQEPEKREMLDLIRDASLVRFVELYAEDRKPEGAEAEALQHFLGADNQNRFGGKVIPLHMFLTHEGIVELRANEVAAGDGHAMTHAIYDMIYARSDAAFLGARFESVNAGTQRYPVVTGVPTLEFAAEGANIAHGDVKIESKDIDPVEGAMSYTVGRSSLLRFPPGMVDAAFRRNTQMGMSDGTDTVVVKGESSPLIPGFQANNAASFASPSGAGVAIETANHFLTDVYGSRVDGKYANTWRDVRALVRPEVYRKIFMEPIATGSTVVFDQFVGENQFRASGKLNAPAARNSVNNISDVITYSPLQDPGDLVVAMWPDVGVIFDQVTRAAQREIVLTFQVAMNIVFKRTDHWTLVATRHA